MFSPFELVDEKMAVYNELAVEGMTRPETASLNKVVVAFQLGEWRDMTGFENFRETPQRVHERNYGRRVGGGGSRMSGDVPTAILD